MDLFTQARLFTSPINNSPLLAGLAMLTLNIGSKYVEMGFSKTQEQALRAGLAREMLIFSMVFMATKDVVISILMTAAFFILSEFAFNEKSSFCMIPHSLQRIAMEVDRNGDNHISEQEERDAIEILRKAKKQREHHEQVGFTAFLDQSHYKEL